MSARSRGAYMDRIRYLEGWQRRACALFSEDPDPDVSLDELLDEADACPGCGAIPRARPQCACGWRFDGEKVASVDTTQGTGRADDALRRAERRVLLAKCACGHLACEHSDATGPCARIVEYRPDGRRRCCPCSAFREGEP